MATTFKWYPVASTGIKVPSDHGAYERIRSAIPAAFTSPQSAQVNGERDDSTLLSRVLLGVADSYDKLLTDTDGIQNIWNPYYTPTALLRPLSATLGMSWEPALGPGPQRSLITNAVRIYNTKGTDTGIGLLAQSAGGVDTTTQVGKNLIPSVGSSGYSGSTRFTSTLGKDAAIGDATITLTHVRGWPTVTPAWVVVRSAAGVEPMLVTEFDGSVLTVDRGTTASGRFGFPQLAHDAGADVTMGLAIHNWAMSAGYDYRTVGSGDTGFAMPTTAITDQPPAVDTALEITRRSSLSTATPTLSYGPLRYVADYKRVGRTGYVTTRSAHGVVVGQRVTAMFGTASVTSNTAATYSVTTVLDPHRFTVFHPEASVSDATLAPADAAASPSPYMIALPHPATTVTVTAGTTYTYSTYVRAGSTTRAATPKISWYDARGTLLSTSSGSATTDSNSAWTRISVSAAAPTNAVLAGLTVSWSVAWSASEIHYVTQHQFEAAGSATAYDDGGLIKVGFNSRADIDPNRVIRTRTREMLGTYAAERAYRVQFTNRSVDLTSGKNLTTSGSVNHAGDTNWATNDLDLKVRLKATALSGDQRVLRATNGTNYWELVVGATQLKFNHTFNPGATVTTLTSSAHSMAAGTIYWLRLTRTTGGGVSLYISPDNQSTPTAWTLLGTGTFAFTSTSTLTNSLVLGATFAGSIYMSRITSGFTLLSEMDAFHYDVVQDAVPNDGGSGGDSWLFSDDTVTVSTVFP